MVNAQHFPMNLPNYDYKQWHFGFTLGFNAMNFISWPVKRLDYNPDVLIIEPVASQGMNVGIVANKRLAQYLDLRFVPTLSFGERKLRYEILEQDTIHRKYLKSVESTFLDFPFTVKYKSKRLPGSGKNTRVYVLGGLRYSIDLASQKNKKSNNDDIIIKLNRHDFMITSGFGFDFYFQWFKFGIELQTAFGMMNVLYHEDNQFTSNLDRLTSRMTWITFTFE
jgi:predicted outer membrane lipoprotein